MLREMTVEEVRVYLEEHPGTPILDVREQEEWDAGHIEGAQLFPLSEIDEHLTTMIQIAKKGPTIMQCAKGGRSAIAAQHMLQVDPELELINMLGGYMVWSGQGLSQ